MALPEIQHAGLYFSGSFIYSTDKVNSMKVSSLYTDLGDYYTTNKAYFDQKYYPNWLHILYPEGDYIKTYGLNDFSSSILKYQGPTKQIDFKIRDIDYVLYLSQIKIYLFKENIGIFTLKINIPENHLNFDAISSVSNYLRNTTDNLKYKNTNVLLKEINEKVIIPLGDIEKDWKQFNPHLKTFINVDVSTAFDTDNDWENTLIDLASVSPIGTAGSEGLYAFADKYQNSLINDQSMEVFKNWKAICLYDTMVRISKNLKTIDTNNLWEEEYYHIYLFISFIRYYLYIANSNLTNLPHIVRKMRLRESYIKFLNDVDLVQISYKFLPNIIYEKLMLAMLIKEEMDRLEVKLNRIETFVRETQQSRIANMLLFFTLLSIFSVILNGSQLALELLNIDKTIHTAVYTYSFRITSLVLLIFSGCGLLVFYRKKK